MRVPVSVAALVSRRGGLPLPARVTVAAGCAAGGLCAAPALRPGTSWGTVAVLAALYAVCEPGVVPARVTGRYSPAAIGPFLPALLAGALLLPPAAAALVAVPGSLAARPVPWVRRVWRAGHLAVAGWTASLAARLLHGPRALRAADLPYALLPSAAAALAFCGTAVALTGAVLVTAEGRSPGAAWGTPLRGSLAPHLTYGLVALMTAVLWLGGYGAFAAVLVPVPMYVACWVFAAARRERAAHQATVRALVQAVEIKDPYTRGHSERVGRASAMIARELGMSEERVDALRLAGILHDIGKLGVPTRVLRKEGPLTAEERRLIQLHPEYGHEMVRGIAFLDEARAAILHHHERLDGTGYPAGLAGHRIPEFARVVAVADAFDAMTSTRSYRPARPVPAALGELHRCAGTHFDPPMVAALTRALSATASGGVPSGRGGAGVVGSAEGAAERDAPSGRGGGDAPGVPGVGSVGVGVPIPGAGSSVREGDRRGDLDQASADPQAAPSGAATGPCGPTVVGEGVLVGAAAGFG